jgi:hypothetical protein
VGIVTQRAEKIHPAKSWPIRIDEHALGISGLPEQEAGKPGLAARADHEVGIGQTARIEVVRQSHSVDVLREVFRSDSIGEKLDNQGPTCVNDLLAAPVTEREVELPSAELRTLLRLFDRGREDSRTPSMMGRKSL